MASKLLLLLTLAYVGNVYGAYSYGSYYKLFAANSLWNSKPVSPVLDTTYTIPLSPYNYFPSIGEGAYSTGCFLAQASDPAVTIYPLSGNPGVWNIDALEWAPTFVIPHWPSTVAAATGTDGHADIVDEGLNIVHSFWGLKQQNGKWAAQQYAWAPLDGTGFGDGGHYWQGARSAGVPTSAGVIRKHEINDGDTMFRHALAMSMAANGLSKTYVYPATAKDGDAEWVNTGGTPIGTRMMLPADFDTSKSGSVRPFLKKVAETLKTYGAYVVDRNGDTPYVIYVENGSGLNLMPNGWDGAVADELQRIRAALRKVKSTSSFIDGNGSTRQDSPNFQLMSMRGIVQYEQWKRTAGDANVRFDTWSQALSYDTSNSQPSTHSNWGGSNINQVNWASLVGGSKYVFSVISTAGAQMSFVLRVGDNDVYNSGVLSNGQSVTFTYPAGAFTILTVYKPAGGPGKVRGTVVAQSSSTPVSNGYIGCYIDAQNGGSGTRDLPYPALANDNTMTVDKCKSACSTAGYQYAGAQYGLECWCGNSYGTQGGAAPASDCNVACAGNAQQICGAGWRNSVYKVTTATPKGLYDQQSAPASIANDATGVNLGLVFKVDTAGQVKGVQVYRGANAQINSATLWGPTGTALATVTFSPTSSSAAGWITGTFSSGISVSANTQYTISYFTPNGQYAALTNGFKTARTVNRITAGVNAGVYVYGSSVAYPPTSSFFSASEYYVSPLFA